MLLFATYLGKVDGHGVAELIVAREKAELNNAQETANFKATCFFLRRLERRLDCMSQSGGQLAVFWDYVRRAARRIRRETNG